MYRFGFLGAGRKRGAGGGKKGQIEKKKGNRRDLLAVRLVSMADLLYAYFYCAPRSRNDLQRFCDSLRAAPR
jgi:hypothetical protein